uniref:Centrosomal protein of 162 kDa n=1 Tax=Geospiza parvula TaxID=87175 RepID=A0A8C3NKT6_GEOPR
MVVKNIATFFPGMLEANGNFLKMQNTSQPVGESHENMDVEKMQKSNGDAVSLSRDSLETNVLASGPNQSIVGVGLDTLEEQEEKEIFFAKLEREASSTIDYSRLNKELDSNDSVVLAPFVRTSSSGTSNYNVTKYSVIRKVQIREFLFSLTFIFLVVLLDSQDSAVELQKAIEASNVAPGEHDQPEEVSAAEMNEAGTSYGQATSDMEALYQAYHHIDQSLGDTGEQKLHNSAVAVSEGLGQSMARNNDIYAKNMSPVDSDLPTVEELMKTITGHMYNTRHFDVDPERYLFQDSLKLVLNQCVLSQALRSCSLKNERSEPMSTKPKNIRSQAPVLKKKPSHGPHGLVRSSGYGKPSLLSKQSFPVSEKKTPKETFKKTLSLTLFCEGFIIQLLVSVVLLGFVYLVISSLLKKKKNKNPPDLSFSPFKSCDRELYLLKRLQTAEEDLSRAQDLIQQLASKLSQKEKEMEAKIVELKTQHEKELSRLGQENYVLQSKLRSMEEITQEKRWTHAATIPITEEKLAQIQKEIEDQEVIIQGYQQENERLYKQMKELQIQNKKNEERMFKENQCLKSELIQLREKIEKINNQSRVMQDSEPARNQSFTELISELRVAQKEEAKLQEEIRRLKQDKQALEVDLVQAKKERDLAKVQIASASSEKSYEFKVMEESYKQEITHLKKRLQWYAENQDLLDKDAARLKDAREEIEKLKLEVEKLRAEAGDQCVQQKKRLRDRAADAKRIQDLERYPNSLPALIFAAAAAEKTNDLSAKTNTVEFLERRIKKLETELEGKDDEAKKSLRAMEQQFQKIKIQYEQRLAELEQLLAYEFMNEPPKLNGDKATSVELEQELQNLKKTHQITVGNLQTEIENLKTQNSQLKLRSKNDNKDLESMESKMKQGSTKDRLLKLNEELVTKNREIQDLTKTVEKLQKERMVMLSDNNLRNKPNTNENSTEVLKNNTSATDKRNSNNTEPCLSIFTDDKTHQPHTFSDSHLLKVVQENAHLKEELEKLSLEMSQQRVKSQAALAYSESNMRRMQEDTAEYIASLQASHQREVEKIVCQHAKEHSTSKVAELKNRISAQEILIKHLQEQLGEQERRQEALLVSQIREQLLQKEVTKLLEELREARESQSPEMKHFLCLEKKIKHIESRHAAREHEIQKVHQLRQTQEVERWRRLAQQKNQELEKFRMELDSILDVLRELQKQGVVIPAPDSSGFRVTGSC